VEKSSKGITMKILVLQHAVEEHPGSFRKLLREDGHEWTPVQLDLGEPLPELDGFDALWVLGGPMDVWEEDAHPWLIEEKKFIQNAVVEKGLPFLGLCLGHQLLAEALGGSCGPSRTPEIGVLPVQLTEVGANGVIFDDLPDKFSALQWHSAEIQQMPAGAECLATSPECAVQAMCWGPRAYSMQFHIEVEPDTVANWSAIPAYAEALTKALGKDGVQQMDQACATHMPDFEKIAERLYINWLQTAAH
jgi:GMP synthase-like glutamine amidotransferase